MIFPLVALISSIQSGNVYNAKLGQPYLVGTVGRMPGTNSLLEMGLQRIVTLNSVESTMAFGFLTRTFVASEGHKLIVFRATIENPEVRPIALSDSDCFGLRIYDAALKAGDVRYLGAGTPSLEDLRIKLSSKKKQDVISVYEFPDTSPNLRIGIYFDKAVNGRTPKYDLSSEIKAPKSVFAVNALTYSRSAKSKLNEAFDLDDLTFKVLGIANTKDGIEVRVEVTNPFPLAGRWGWQYGKAELGMSDGKVVEYYPDFFVEPAFENWNHELKSGQKVIGRYRFNPSSGSPLTFTLNSNATKRKVVVGL